MSLTFVFRPLENSKYLDYVCENFESPSRVWMGPNLYIFVTDAKCAEQVLKGRSTVEKPQVYEAIRDALGGDGLFSSNGERFSMFVCYLAYICVDSQSIYSDLTKSTPK